jgi:hypothetical protein
MAVENKNYFDYFALRNEYQDKLNKLLFDIFWGDTSKEDAYKERHEINEWYCKELHRLSSPATIYRVPLETLNLV